MREPISSAQSAQSLFRRNALKTKTNKIGFFGGMNVPLLHSFEAGYRAGANAIHPKIEVMVDYAGVTPQAFSDPARGKELALAQYNKGADVILAAAGATSLGILEAAKCGYNILS